mgnify:CR=1 FL=1
MNRKESLAAIEKLLDRAGDLHRQLVREEALKVMLAHPNLKTFCMGMGSADFTDFAGNTILLDAAKAAPTVRAASIVSLQLPVPVLVRIFKSLKQAELVASKRGAMGGYALNRRPEDISLGEIIRVMEGPLCLTDCCDDAELGIRSGICMTRDAWRRVSAIMASALDSLKLSDVISGVPPFCPNASDDDEDPEGIC